MDALTARQVTNSSVYPTMRIASHPGKLLMGVFDDADAYVPDTVLDRRAGETGAPVPRNLLPAPVPSAIPEAIYAGPLYFHFGHFLLESLARSWYARQHPELPLVWAGAHTWQEASLKSWQTEILEILGITNPALMIADPTRFEKLHLPDIGYRYDDVFHPEHAAFLGQYQGPEQEAGTRLWLSRNKLASEWRDLNAGPTERRLSAAGWTVVSPEQLTVRQQLDHLARAEIIAGEEGSAFHTIMLLRDPSTKRLEVFRRHGREHGNLHTIGNTRQVRQRFHSLTSEHVLEAKGRYVSKLNPNASEILRILDVPVPAVPTSTRSGTDPDVEYLLGELDPNRLLTVGHTHMSAAVRSTTAVVRVAVSPRFDFDPRSYAGDQVQFFEIDLAQYAESFHDKEQRFDAIWIEAADFGEYMRSFDLTKAMAADRAVWIFGTGPLAARCALAVQLAHPGYTVQRTLVQDSTILTVRRQPGEPTGLADIAALSDQQVARRLRPPLSGPLRWSQLMRAPVTRVRRLPLARALVARLRGLPLTRALVARRRRVGRR